jgi:hypothetical protein
MRKTNWFLSANELKLSFQALPFCRKSLPVVRASRPLSRERLAPARTLCPSKIARDARATTPGAGADLLKKKMFFRGNELEHLKQIKDLANLNAQNELVFECVRTQNEPKINPFTRFWE